LRDRVAIRHDVAGDLRFISHHDTLRLWERALALAGGALLVFPGLVSDGIGIVLMIVIAITSSRRRRATLIERQGASRP